MKDNVNVFMLSETKLVDFFPLIQFCMKGYSPSLRLDQNTYGSVNIVHVPEDIPHKLIPIIYCSIEGFFYRIELKEKTIGLRCSFSPNHTFYFASREQSWNELISSLRKLWKYLPSRSFYFWYTESLEIINFEHISHLVLVFCY